MIAPAKIPKKFINIELSAMRFIIAAATWWIIIIVPVILLVKFDVELFFVILFIMRATIIADGSGPAPATIISGFVYDRSKNNSNKPDTIGMYISKATINVMMSPKSIVSA